MQWDGKPYHSLDFEMKRRYHEKVYRLALNGGMTCPNRDGTAGTGGCIFCSQGGSGDFAASARLSVAEQLREQKAALRAKRPVRKFIAYFQAYTNTYAPVGYLEQLFTAAISDPETEILSIATRPDCLPEEVLSLLSRLNERKPVWVELGLQTIHEDTARLIRRGYPLSCFEQAVRALRGRGIEVIVHTILGLPGETRAQMLQTVEWLNHADIQGIKLQLLHILKGTDLGALYLRQLEEPSAETAFPRIRPLEMDEYAELIVDCVERLSPDIVIHRLTGDGPRRLLLAPMWSTRKHAVLNTVHAAFRARGTWQGRCAVPYH